MKITQSQLKSLVRTIVKESVSELTKGKRRRSLRENAGKKILVWTQYNDDDGTEAVIVNGKRTSVGKLALAKQAEVEAKYPGFFDGDLQQSLDDNFDRDNNPYHDIFKLNGITHEQTVEDDEPQPL